jgi:hypothetical protein
LRVRFSKACSTDRFLELRHVEHPVLKPSVDANLKDASPDSRHGLPIRWQETLLHAAELVSRVAASVCWEGPEVIERRAQPRNGLLGHGTLYTYLYDAIKLPNHLQPTARLIMNALRLMPDVRPNANEYTRTIVWL